MSWPLVWTELIAQLHDRAIPSVLVVTGGGSSAISGLLEVPGASRTVLEGRVPYASSALIEWLGKEPEHYCHEHTALAMATAACSRARLLNRAGSVTAPIGVSCTASLASDRPKRGPHRCYLALHSADGTSSWHLELKKGARTRHEEESLVSQLVIGLMARHAGLNHPDLALQPDETLITDSILAASSIRDICLGNRDVVWSRPDGELVDVPPRPVKGLLCGAFDPLHQGHAEMRDVAEEMLQSPVAYEISVTNVDKPALDYLSIERRRQQFTRDALALTNAPRFLQKARLFPGMTFVVGSDTAERIIDARYYQGQPEARDAGLAAIRAHGCRFLVAARSINGQLVRLEDLPLPPSAEGLFDAIPESRFRVDVSSTALRRQRA